MMLIEFEMWASRIQHLVDTWSCHVVISWSIFGAWRTADARSWKIQGESVGGGRINRTRFLRCWFFVTRRVQFIHKQKKKIYIYTYIAKLKLLGLLRCFFFCLLFFYWSIVWIIVDVASWVQMGRSWSKRGVMGNIPSQSLTWLTWKWNQNENRDEPNLETHHS